MKNVSKYNEISLNDLFISILSNSLHAYFEKYKHEAPAKANMEDLKFGLPFSLRENVKSMDELQINNDLCIFVEPMKIIADFETAK